MGLLILFGIIIGVLAVIVFGIIEIIRSTPVDCPVCGKKFKLPNRGGYCPNCRVRVVKTEDGNIISTT